MEKIIKISSRNGDNNYLKLMPKSNGSESKTYILKTENQYVSTGYTSDKKFYVIPSGSPMLIEGEEVPNVGIIESIDLVYGYGYFITFK